MIFCASNQRRKYIMFYSHSPYKPTATETLVSTSVARCWLNTNLWSCMVNTHYRLWVFFGWSYFISLLLLVFTAITRIAFIVFSKCVSLVHMYSLRPYSAALPSSHIKTPILLTWFLMHLIKIGNILFSLVLAWSSVWGKRQNFSGVAWLVVSFNQEEFM